MQALGGPPAAGHWGSWGQWLPRWGSEAIRGLVQGLAQLGLQETLGFRSDQALDCSCHCECSPCPVVQGPIEVEGFQKGIAWGLLCLAVGLAAGFLLGRWCSGDAVVETLSRSPSSSSSSPTPTRDPLAVKVHYGDSTPVEPLRARLATRAKNL